MRCEGCVEALTAHALGEALPDPARDHLEGCAACRARLDDVRRRVREMDDLLSAELSVVPSPAFAARVRQRVADSRQAAGWWGWWPTVAAGAAVVVLAVSVDLSGPDLAAPVPAPPAAAGRDIVLPGPSPQPSAPLVAARADDGTPKRPAGLRLPRPASPRSNEPEVLVPPGPRLALRRFAARLNAGLIGPVVGQVEMPLEEIVMAPVEVPLITIAPVELPPPGIDVPEQVAPDVSKRVPAR